MSDVVDPDGQITIEGQRDEAFGSVEVPFKVTVNTSGTTIKPLTGHSLSTTNGGFTKISEFTFDSKLATVRPDHPSNLSNNICVWDFGDGYTLSASNAISATHIYHNPGIYTVQNILYDSDGGAIINTDTQTVSVFNYLETNVLVASEDQISVDVLTFPASSKTKPFTVGVSASWHDLDPKDENHTLFIASSGSKSKPYDTKNKYAHLMPFNAFYTLEDDILPGKIDFQLYKNYYVIDSDKKIQRISESVVDSWKNLGIQCYMLGGTSTYPTTAIKHFTVASSVTSYDAVTDIYERLPEKYIDTHKDIKFTYYDDTPNVDPGVRLLTKFDTSKHGVRNFYVDGIEDNINNSGQPFLETAPTPTYESNGTHLYISKPSVSRISFTSTGVKEMSAIQHKRQGDKFQLFLAYADKDLNIIKSYPGIYYSTSHNPVQDNSFYVELSTANGSGNPGAGAADIHTSVLSSVSTDYLPYELGSGPGGDTTGQTLLSSFAYLNINPLSAGTWTLNVTGRIDSFTSISQLSGYGKYLDYDGDGPLGPVSLGAVGNSLITGSYTFTIAPSTNDVEIYKKNEDCDYGQKIKDYRFQSFLHEYDNLFDGVFTAFVGTASSSPTVFGKTVFEKIANFVDNNSDVDFCKLENIQSFYDFFNEDIDIVLPQPPPELKRLYDLFSVKITKLLGDYEKDNNRLNSNFYTASADGRNVDFNNPITAETYTVSAYTNFVAQQKFNNQFICIKPQKIASTNVYAVDPVLLIRGNVGSGSSFSDSSTSTTTHTITANRNATHSTTQSKFTGGSIKIDGDSGGTNADYLCAGPHDDFVFRTDDFTIDCWMYVESFADYEGIFSQGCKTNNNMLHALEVTADGAVRWLIRATYHELVASTGSETIDMRTPNGTISTDTWHHIAAVREGAYFYIFIDGVLQAKSDEDAQPWPINKGANQGGFTTRSSTGNYWYDPANGTADLIALTNASGVEFPIYIGARVRNPSSNIDSMHGYIDEFRITRTAIWTSDFTPPATRGGGTVDSSYPLSAYNVSSNWGWPLDTSVVSTSGLTQLYNFYPYVEYDETSTNKNIKNSLIDFNNEYTSITRSNSALETDWNPAGGIIYKNIDYQIRKGLNL